MVLISWHMSATRLAVVTSYAHLIFQRIETFLYQARRVNSMFITYARRVCKYRDGHKIEKKHLNVHAAQTSHSSSAVTS